MITVYNRRPRRTNAPPMEQKLAYVRWLDEADEALCAAGKPSLFNWTSEYGQPMSPSADRILRDAGLASSGPRVTLC